MFGARVEQAFGAALRRIGQRAGLIAIVILLSFGAVGVILWIGGHDVLAGNLSAGALSITANSHFRDEAYLQRGDVTFVPYDGYLGPSVDTMACGKAPSASAAVANSASRSS